ncbi:Alpha/Beta hydrolase protein [Trichoderma austrokoningii]
MTTHQTAKTSYVPYRDGKIAYRRFGASSGVPLLFLIHFRGTMDKWDPLLINNIAASRPVILVDYVGVGLSTGVIANNFRDWADNMLDFLSLIDVKEVDLLGFSLGGFVAQMMILNGDANKLKVRKLILVGTAASTGPDLQKTTNDYIPYAGAPDAELSNMKVLFFPQNPVGDKAAEEWWARIQERNEATSGEVPSEWLSQGYKDGGAGLKAQVNALEKWSDPETSRGLDGSYDRLEQIDIPVLIANGSNDFMVPTINSFHVQQKLPNATLLVYPNSGHASHYQYAEKFARQAVQFLED